LFPNQKGLLAAFGKDFKEIKTTKLRKEKVLLMQMRHNALAFFSKHFDDSIATHAPVD